MSIDTVEQLEKEQCTGCGSCSNACPSICISMEPDRKGFLYPKIDTKKCIRCHKCVSVCPMLNENGYGANQKEPEVYAAWSTDEEIRYNSTSGGIFSELAKLIISRGGCVAGAKYTEEFLVEHELIERIEDIEILRQSKYVQSNSKNIYAQVKEQLSRGREVLFVGTPCQCAGLQKLLGKEEPRLILCDFICRGVNSSLVFRKYLDELEMTYSSKVKQVWFKNKTYGWNQFGTKIIFENGKEYFGSRYEDDFMYGFIRKELNLYMRPSCSRCKCKGIKRPVDITLGDFWGKKDNDERDLGISAVLLNTEKGRKYFGLIKSIIRRKEKVESVIRGNCCLQNNAISSIYSKQFWHDMDNGITFQLAIDKIRRMEKKNE